MITRARSSYKPGRLLYWLAAISAVAGVAFAIGAYATASRPSTLNEAAINHIRTSAWLVMGCIASLFLSAVLVALANTQRHERRIQHISPIDLPAYQQLLATMARQATASPARPIRHDQLCQLMQFAVRAGLDVDPVRQEA